MITVFLLHGHSYWDSGATTKINGTTYLESQIVRDVCLDVYKETLDLTNIRVVLVPRKKSLAELVKHINQLAKDVPGDKFVIEAHLNSASDKSVDRIEAIYWSGSTNGKLLAQKALASMQKYGIKTSSDRLVPREKNENGGYLCYNVAPPAVITEFCFLSHISSEEELNDMKHNYTKALINLIENL